MRPASTSWGTYPLLGLVKDGAANPYEVPAVRIEAHWSDDGYNKFRLGSPTAPGKSIGWSPTFDTALWYKHEIIYDASTDVLTWTVTERDSDLLFHSATYTGITIPEFNQVAVGYVGAPPVYGSWAEIFVDNIQVTPESAPPPVPEPVTMVALLGGIGCLGGYLRRRGRRR